MGCNKAHPEFKKINEIRLQIAGFCVNTPEDLDKLNELLDEQKWELHRLAKVFNLEHLIIE